MSKITIQVEVSKEMHELMSALEKLTLKVKAKAADGLSAGDVLTACVEESNNLVMGMLGVEQLPAEAKEDLESFLNAGTLPLNKAIAGLLKPAAAPAPAPAPAEAPGA